MYNNIVYNEFLLEVKMSKSFQHLIDLNDYPIPWWNKIIKLGHDIKNNPHKYSDGCRGNNGYPIL